VSKREHFLHKLFLRTAKFDVLRQRWQLDGADRNWFTDLLLRIHLRFDEDETAH